ncbi:hypothetical protein RJI07_03175 [Mycoplasmatota bacterium WC30]
MSRYTIMTVLISHRNDCAEAVQLQLTKFGCNIKMRLGMHEASSICSEDGLIILQLTGDKSEINSLSDNLNAIKGVKTQMITLSSD